jgi:GTP-binding protein EngB required for normal cell division
MPELNPAQQSHLRASLARIDSLLSDATRALDQQGETRFGRHRPDATPVQRKVLADYAARVRARMGKALAAFDVPPAPAVTGTVAAARTSILFAQIALQEIEPRAMRGYGALGQEAERELSAASADLMEALHDIETYLAQGSARDLDERLRRLGGSAFDHRTLAELERVITRHGLTELRPTLRMLIERLESPQLELAVFGRTSAGKSSLLNRLLETAALPVGVTPVTSVPLRIVYGRKPWGRAWFADAIPESFPLGRLAEFVDAHYNPSNVRHVTAITVELPVPILGEGISLVDTPGLGSLATAGAAETLAYLPRCDVGIVLVDAAGTLTHQDVSLVDALHRAGASVMVLLTKADLISANERWQSLGYLRQELESRTGLELPIHCVSVVGADAALCDAWRDEVLLPWLRAHKRGLQLSLRRKIGLLHDAAITALERRLESGDRKAAVGHAFVEALELLNASMREQPPFPDLKRAAVEVQEEVAHNTAVLWSRNPEGEVDAGGLLAASLSGRAGAAAREMSRDLARLRARLATALADAATPRLARFDEELPQAGGMPIFDPPRERLSLRRPSLSTGLWLRRSAARRQLRRIGLTHRVEASLEEYQARLLDWRARALEGLKRSFRSQRDLLRSDDVARATDATERRAIKDDIERLGRLGSQPANEPVGASR